MNLVIVVVVVVYLN